MAKTIIHKNTGVKDLDYKHVFGTEGARSQAQKRIWKDLVMNPLLEKSSVEKLDPKTARDLAIEIYNQVNRES